MSKPNPGSPEARELGCICPIADNGGGKLWILTDGERAFWINTGCKVHGVTDADREGAGQLNILEI